MSIWKSSKEKVIIKKSVCEQQNAPFLQSQVLGLGSLVPTAGNISRSWEYSKCLSFTGIPWCLIKMGLMLQPVLRSFSMYLRVCGAFESSVLLLDLCEMYHWAQKLLGWVVETDLISCSKVVRSVLARLFLALGLKTAEQGRLQSNSTPCTSIFLLVTVYLVTSLQRCFQMLTGIASKSDHSIEICAHFLYMICDSIPLKYKHTFFNSLFQGPFCRGSRRFGAKK